MRVYPKHKPRRIKRAVVKGGEAIDHSDDPSTWWSPVGDYIPSFSSDELDFDLDELPEGSGDA